MYCWSRTAIMNRSRRRREEVQCHVIEGGRLREAAVRDGQLQHKTWSRGGGCQKGVFYCWVSARGFLLLG